MSNKLGYGLIPHFAQFDAVSRVQELEGLLGVKELLPTAEAQNEAGKLAALKVGINDAGATAMANWKFFTLVLCMMAGTASLPHVLMRYFTTASVKAARQSVGWSLLFICLLYLTAPALATFTKLSLLDPTVATSIIGKSISEVSSLEWIQQWSNVGFLRLVDGNGNGVLQINEFFMRGDIVVLATPEMAGLPYVISGLVAAGGLAAAMSTADGLLLAIANALSHDLYYKVIDPKADTSRRLIVARVLLLFIGAAGAFVASLKLTSILGAVAWAFCFANSGLFFPLVLGVWWKRANKAGAVAGMIGGFGVGFWYLYMVQFGGMTPWYGIDGLRFGMIGMPVSLILMVVVSLMTEEPDQETQDMVDAIRIPKGKALLAADH
jgi:cation/acetate symporter